MDDVSTFRYFFFVSMKVSGSFHFVSICAQFAPKFIDNMEMKLNNKL